MNTMNKSVKHYLKSLPPLTALELFDRYKIPSPQKEVLISACIDRCEGWSGVDNLAEKYNINISYFSFGRRLKEGLEIFRKSHQIYHDVQEFC